MTTAAEHAKVWAVAADSLEFHSEYLNKYDNPRVAAAMLARSVADSYGALAKEQEEQDG